MPLKPRQPFKAALLAVCVLSGAACHPSAGAEQAAASETAEPARKPIATALFSSLPIARPENVAMEDLLREDVPAHWATSLLTDRGEWRAVDWLGIRDDGYDALAGIDLLVMAQPRPLAPEENVALDNFVRDGGTVLLFADPHLTQESAYALGDPRRPGHTVLLSPILSRWGIELEHDESDEKTGADWNGVTLPLSEAGRFRLKPDAGEFAGRCVLEAEARLVSCEIGKGRLLALADAALLEPDTGGRAEIRRALLERLIDAALASEVGKSRD